MCEVSKFLWIILFQENDIELIEYYLVTTKYSSYSVFN